MFLMWVPDFGAYFILSCVRFQIPFALTNSYPFQDPSLEIPLFKLVLINDVKADILQGSTKTHLFLQQQLKATQDTFIYIGV